MPNDDDDGDDDDDDTVHILTINTSTNRCTTYNIFHDSYMFRHRNAILWESSRTKEYKYNTLI
jgi:hypothetical protein